MYFNFCRPDEDTTPKTSSVKTANGTASTGTAVPAYQYNNAYGQQYDQFGQYSNWSTSGYPDTHEWSAYQGYYG